MVPPPAAAIVDHVASLDDPRVGPATRHRLLDIVAIALCAVICGADGWVEVEQFGKDTGDRPRTFLPLPHGIPSHGAFGRVFAALDAEPVERGFASWVQAIARLTAGEAVAVDGKGLRRSHDRAAGKAALALVGAWAGTDRLTLGPVAVAGGSREIAAIPERLRLLALRGCIVTVDAIGCQTAIARRVVARDADHVLAPKENQGTLFEAVEVLFAAGRATGFADLEHTTHRTAEKGHGRLEIRRVWAVGEPEVIADLDPTGAWPGLRSVGVVEAERRVGERVSREARSYLSSLPGDAERCGAAVRGHWGIENDLHWVLDVACREDESRVRQGAADHNLALLRRLALTPLRREQPAKVGTKAKRPKAGRSTAYLLKVLAG